MTRVTFGVVAFSLVAGSAWAQDDGLFEEQDFLFQLEEAYTQDAGEWQVGASFDRSFNSRGSLYEFEVEYGFTDRIQGSFSLPVIDNPGADGVGDIELGLDYAVLKDTGRGSPEVTLGAEFSLPTGDEDEGLGNGSAGIEVSARASQQFHPDVHGHALVAYEWITNGGSGADSLREWSLGVGAAWEVQDPVTVVVEYLRERERAEVGPFVSRETESYLSAGFVFELIDDLEFGLAGAVGLTDDSADGRFLAKIQFEFGG